jgi:hypothetical protein
VTLSSLDESINMSFKTGIHRIAQVAKWLGRMLCVVTTIGGRVAAFNERSS